MTRKTGSVLSVVIALLCASCDSKPGDEYRAADEVVNTPVDEPAPAPAKPANQVKPAETPTGSAAATDSKESVKTPQQPAAESPAKMAAPSKEAATPADAPVVAKTATPDAAKMTTPSAAAPAESKESAPQKQMATPAKDASAASSPASPANSPAANASASKETPANSTPATAMPANGLGDAPKIPTGPLPIKLLIPEKQFTAEGSEQALRVTFDDIDLLKVLNMEPVPEGPEKHFPEWLSNLNGKRIILRGWMYPPASQEGISRFMFVRDNGICCFGRAPKVYDKLGVTLRKGVTTNYIQNRPFDVIGTLLIEPEIDPTDEGQSWLYFLEDAIVIDTGRS